MKYLPGGTGLREGGPPHRVPRLSRALLQGVAGRHYGAPTLLLLPLDVLIQDELARSMRAQVPTCLLAQEILGK